MIRLIGYIVLPVVLLFYIKDKRIASSRLKDQRLPKILSFLDDDSEFGLNGPFIHQCDSLLGSPQSLRESTLNNAILCTYDREQTGTGNPVPKYKIYWMRLTWAVK